VRRVAEDLKQASKILRRAVKADVHLCETVAVRAKLLEKLRNATRTMDEVDWAPATSPRCRSPRLEGSVGNTVEIAHDFVDDLKSVANAARCTSAIRVSAFNAFPG